MSSSRWALGLAVLTLAAFAVLIPWRASLSEVWGDEGTYLAMAESLAHDADLRFEVADRDRLAGESQSPGRSTVILQRAAQGIAYSKPILFPLLAAPLVLLLGTWGAVVLNAVALALALALGFAYLERQLAGERAAWVLVTFVGASALLPYVLWRMSDVLQAALALAGFALCFGQARGEAGAGLAQHRWQRCLSWWGAPYLGGVLLGLMTSMRLTNGALAAAPFLAALLKRQWRQALGMAAGAAVAFLLVLGLTGILTGSITPYRAERTSFNAETGYPVGPEAASALERFSAQAATVRTNWFSTADPRSIAYSTFYFFCGRHSSLLFYFPAALILLAAAIRSGDRVSLALLLCAGGFVGFYLGWLPGNYFGGDTFIGNRYFLPAYPALLIALRRLPGWRSLACAWVIGAISWGSAAVSLVRAGQLDPSSQNHAYAGIFRLLPYESTAPDIAGRRDRYWSDHFVRFVDPFAQAGPWHFELTAGSPPAELLVAHWQPLAELQFWVTTEAHQARLRVSDYGHEQDFELVPTAKQPQGQAIAFAPARAWRHHLFWWDPQTLYTARTLRLQLLSADGQPAQATLRYVGAMSYWNATFGCDLVQLTFPAQVQAGSTTSVRARLRNTGFRTWQPQDVFPVYAQYRLSNQDGLVQTSEPLPLPRAVGSQEEIELNLAVTWPARPGDYVFALDLHLAQLGSFQDRLGYPVTRQNVVVRPAQEPKL